VDDARTTLERALTLHQQGRFAEAEPLYRAALAAAPANAQAQYLLGALLVQQGRDAEALAPLETAVRLAPDDDGFAFELAAWERRACRLAAAERRLAAIVARRPDDVDARFELGETTLERGRRAEGLALMAAAAAAAPERDDLRRRLAARDDDPAALDDVLRRRRRLAGLAEDGPTNPFDDAADDAPAKDVLIVVHDQPEFVADCLESVERATRNATVFVWDNASAAPTRDLLRDHAAAGRIVLRRSEENVGFVEPNNELARLGSAPYVVLLNSDCTVARGWDVALIDLLRDDPGVGVAGYQGALLDRNGCGAIEAYGDEIDYVSGWCLALRRAEIDPRGLFDPAIRFAYGEDADLSLRLRRDGRRPRALPLQWALHFGGRTIAAVRGERDLSAEMAANQRLLRSRWGAYLDEDRVAARRAARRAERVAAVCVLDAARGDVAPALAAAASRFRGVAAALRGADEDARRRTEAAAAALAAHGARVSLAVVPATATDDEAFAAALALAPTDWVFLLRAGEAYSGLDADWFVAQFGGGAPALAFDVAGGRETRLFRAPRGADAAAVAGLRALGAPPIDGRVALVIG